MDITDRNHARYHELINRSDTRWNDGRRANAIPDPLNGQPNVINIGSPLTGHYCALNLVMVHYQPVPAPFSLEIRQGVLIVRIEEQNLMTRRAVSAIDREVRSRLGECQAVIIDFAGLPVRATVRFFLALCNLHRKATAAGVPFQLCGLTRELRDALVTAGFFFQVRNDIDQAISRLNAQFDRPSLAARFKNWLAVLTTHISARRRR